MLGHFNPALVHPAWLARHELVRDAEVAAADISLVRPELTIFKVGPFRFQAEPRRFHVGIVDLGQLSALRDLVLGVFSLLGETPITQFGLNRDMHFRMPDAEAWHRVGNLLAPKDKWAGLVDDPGLRSVCVQGKWGERASTRVQVTVEPSTKVPSGVYVAVNEHFEIGGDDAAPAVNILRTAWTESFARARQVAEAVVGLGLRS